ncbi:MAG: NHL repeat-containing protein [Opitutaceae bacterium]|nr:NHL repeat-containing protein [Opitutaceae bacterium]
MTSRSPRRSRRFGPTLATAIAISALAALTARADTYIFNTVAGSATALDHVDGTGTNARFMNLTGVAVDAGGNLYIADGGDHTVRKVTPAGVVTTLAGSSGQAGSANGAGSNARFVYPFALAVDNGGNVYVTDIGNHNVRKITAGGNVSTLAGGAGVAGSLDGTGTAALFSYPQGIAVDGAGNVFVSDTDNSTIRRISTSGVVTTFAGAAAQTGTADGGGSSARFNYPWGLAVDVVGNIYVADQGNSVIRKIDTGGNVTTLAGSAGLTGGINGQGTGARFDHPSAVSVDAAGTVYVIDTSNQLIRKISVSGSVSTLAGTPGQGGRVDGAGAAARFFYPQGIAVNSLGTIYVADTGNHTLRVVTAAGAVGTLAGAAGVSGSTDGSGSGALFAYPDGVAVDGSGNLYIADHDNHTIRKVNTSGGVTTLAGVAGLSGSADGVGGAARFNAPTGVAVDGGGNVYVADAGNSSIRKITAGGSVTTFAGFSGIGGSSDGLGTSARFNVPQGIAVDSSGNVYVADTNNNTIRMVTTAGTVTTIAGAAGQNGNSDGFGAAARFGRPYALAVDSGGNVYVADFFNATIRKITTAGSVTTLAGFAGRTGMTDGFGAAARFNQPYGVAVDSRGEVFVADTYNRAVRQISPSGAVTTVGGANSRFFYPQGIATDSAGNLYITDGDNHSVTKATFVGPPPPPPVGEPGAARLINVSVRTFVGTGDSTVAVGFGLSGTGSKQLLIRGVGPTLAVFNVSGQLDNPVLSLFNSSSVMMNSNSGWGGGAALTSAFSSVGAFALPANSVDTALFQSLPAGTTYSALISGANSTTGIALAEVYDADPGTPATRLTNVSARAFSGTGLSALTAGFVIAGTGTETLLIRGIGPALTQFGVGGALAAPQLTLFNSAGQVIGNNAGWGGGSVLTAAFAQVGAFPLPAFSADSALLVTLPAGLYTVQVSGANASTGIALIEVYEMR